MVSSVSFGHAATNPKVGDRDGESPPASSDPGVLDHSRDGLAHETRGIANRLTFEFRFDARELRIPSEGVGGGVYPTGQIRSSTL
jgi:hypothetical protein